ncbi:rab-GTPase-TBC domain-containing protein [Tirmania nivea]|nr:rab-GTPase-TBC domain-containing protein [Tirmania nivea]
MESTKSRSDSGSTVEYTPPASPSDSYYDLSDNDEEEYNTITHSSTGRGVKLLYSKSKVYVHPTPSAKDNIPGFIALVQQKAPPHPKDEFGKGKAKGTSTQSSSQGSSSTSSPTIASTLLLAWLPESALGDAYNTYVKVDLANEGSDTPPRQSYLVPPPPTTIYVPGTSAVGSYAFAVPVNQIFSLLVRPPSLGWWWGSVVINTRYGDSFPALFFHDSECQSTIAQSRKRAKTNFDPFGESGDMFWGGDEVLRWLRKYVRVEKSELEPSIYLVDPSADDLKSFISAPTLVNRATGVEAVGGGGPSMDPITRAFKEVKWSFLEKLTRVTRFSRRTVEDILDNPRVPLQVRRLLKNPDVQSLQDEFDSARLYLARWAMGIAEQSDREQRKIVWAGKDAMEMEDSAVGEFEILDIETGALKLDSEKRKPVTMEEWDKWFDPTTGRLQVTVDEVKERIFHGGVDPAARKEIWLWLLDVYPWDSTRDERTALMNSKRDEYVRLKGKWWDDMDRRSSDEYWRDQKNRIEKDVHRTDRNIPIFSGEDIPHPEPDSPFAEVGTNVHMEQMKDMLLTYNEHNKGLGYVQGMSDLLAPIYAVMQDDAAAFWAFVGFMDRTERNFLRDQSGMRSQLVTLDHLVQLMDPKLYAHLQSADSTNFFFFFRMLLVWYKREFPWHDVLRLWEVLWTNYLSGQFHLFIALAILERHRVIIMDHLKQFDEVLKYVNELSNTIDLDSTRVRAEALFYRFKRLVEAADRKNSGKNMTGLPEIRQWRVSPERSEAESAGAASGRAATAGGAAARNAVDRVVAAAGSGPNISEELRALLDRSVIRVQGHQS